MNNNYNQNIQMNNQGNMVNQPYQNINQMNNQSTNNKKTGITIAIILVIVVVAIVCILLFTNKKEEKTNNGSNLSNSTQNSGQAITTDTFQANINILTKEEGGRHTPFFNNYKPNFKFGDQEVAGTITLEDGIEMVMPGDNIFATVKLDSPVAMQEGTEFTITEGGRTVGTGVVSKEKQILSNTNSNTNTNTSFENVTIGQVDSNTNLSYTENGAFLMYIEDVFTITGRGTVVTGQVSRGTVKVGDEVQILGLDGEMLTTTVAGIELFRKEYDYAKMGDDAGIILKDVERDQVSRGEALVKPNSMIATTNFEAKITALNDSTKDITSNSQFDIYIGTTSILGKMMLPLGTTKISSGEEGTIIVQLESPVAMEVGTEVSVREGGQTIASGTITKVGK